MPALKQNKISSPEVIALIPAAGMATRLAPLPCSKELIPIGFGAVGQKSQFRPKVVSHYLLEMFKLAGIKKAYFVVHSGKLDIPAYFGSGQMVDMKLAYLLVDLPIAVPYTLDQAYPFVQNKMVALGFPDIILRPDNSFVQLLNKKIQTKADIVLGLYPTDQPNKMDVVDFDKNGCIRQICPKPSKLEAGKVNYAWLTALWTPIFSKYLHTFIAEHKKGFLSSSSIKSKGYTQELFLGDVFQKAIKDKLNVNSVVFSEGSCLDIGTAEDLLKALQKSFVEKANY